MPWTVQRRPLGVRALPLIGLLAFVLAFPQPSRAQVLGLRDPAGHPYQTNVGNTFFPETTTPLSGSATFTGSARDVGVAAGNVQPFAYFNAFFFADQTGTATIECSSDSIAWTTCAKSSLTASTPLTLTVPVMFRYQRAKLVNGSSAEGTLAISTSYTVG